MDQNSAELQNGSYKGVSHEEPVAPADEPPRREFLKKSLAVAAGGAVVATPLAAGVAVLLDPLRKSGGGGELIPVARLDALPADGTPMRFAVITDKTDAWNRFPKTPVGSVYVKRVADQKVVVFSAECPHAGCSVDARPDGTFRCPCHNSTFNADGSLGQPTVSPRGLDLLDAEVRDGVVHVRFRKFLSATHEKIAMG
jgi:Rieske Fe-S protein